MGSIDEPHGCLQKPYKDQLERMLVEYVEPAFQSPHGHLRAKACWVAGTYADIQYEGGAGKGRTFQLLMRHVIQGLQDPELPVSSSTTLNSPGLLRVGEHILHSHSLVQYINESVLEALLVWR